MNSQAPVFLLHSSMSSGRQWHDLCNELNHPSQTPDLAGYGRTPMPDNDLAQYRLAQELRLLPALPDTPFHLVGHSYGGALALKLAREHPDQILSLTLFEPVAFHLLPDNHPQLEAIMALSTSLNRYLDQQQPEDAARRFIDYWNRPGSFDRLPDATRADLKRTIRKVGYDFSALLHEPCTPEDLSTIRCPMLLLEGAYTPASTQAVMQILKQQLPQAQHQLLDCGHMGPVTHPHLVNPPVSRFIAAQNRSG